MNTPGNPTGRRGQAKADGAPEVLSGTNTRRGPGIVLAGLAALGLALSGGGVAARAQAANFSGVVTTLASGLGAPQGTAVDANGNVFYSENVANTLEELVAVNGVVPANTTPVMVASGFSGPSGVAVDASGDVFVADTNNGAVKEIKVWPA